MSGTVTGRDITPAQATYDYEYEKIFIFDNFFLNGQTFVNNSGSEIENISGLVVGRDPSSGNLVPLDPTATDGSQFPVGIILNPATVADAATETVAIGISGRVNENKVKFTGATTLATVVSNRQLRDRLACDTAGILLVASDELSEFDN